MARTGKRRDQRPHRPNELGPRVFTRGRWYAADLRPWGGTRVTLRDPRAKGWPAKGERTDSLEIATRWAWAYVEWLRDGTRRRLLGHPAPGRPLGEAAEAWLEHRETTVEDNTYRNNRAVLGHLREHFGDAIRTDEIEADALQAMFRALRKEGYEPSTLRTERAVLSGFFRWLGGPNPARGVELPAPVQEDIFIWSPDELERLRKAADTVDAARGGARPSARLAVELALATGARHLELFALRWEDIDAAAKSVRIVRQLRRDDGGTKPLKGRRARTALVLPSWWEWHDPDARGLILATDAGKPLGYRSSQHLIQRILDTANLNAPKRGWHDFRRTYGALFLEQTRGSGMHLLQQSLGHKSIKTTEQAYGHLSTAKAIDIARDMVYGEGLRLVR